MFVLVFYFVSCEIAQGPITKSRHYINLWRGKFPSKILPPKEKKLEIRQIQMWATAAAQTSAVPTGPDPQGILESWQFESFENEQVIPRHRYGFL